MTEETRLTSAGLCVGSTAGCCPLGSWTTCLEVHSWPAASSPERAWCERYILCAESPHQRSLGVLSELLAGIHHAKLQAVTSETAWAFPHLTAALLLACLSHHAIYSWRFLCTSVPALIARCCITFTFRLLPSCTSSVSEVLFYSQKRIGKTSKIKGRGERVSERGWLRLIKVFEKFCKKDSMIKLFINMCCDTEKIIFLPFL